MLAGSCGFSWRVKGSRCRRYLDHQRRRCYDFGWKDAVSTCNGQASPALASRLKVSRTVDDATPTRRQSRLSPTPAALIGNHSSRLVSSNFTVNFMRMQLDGNQTSEFSCVWRHAAKVIDGAVSGASNTLKQPRQLVDIASSLRSRLVPSYDRFRISH